MCRSLLIGVIAALMTTATAVASDQENIRALEGRFVKAFLAKDWKALPSLYATDAVLMPPNTAPVSGNQQIAGWFAGAPITITGFNISSADTRIHDGFATNRGAYTITFTMPGSPTPVTDVGKFLWVLRKSSQGNWQVTIDMFSSNNPPPPAK